MRGLKANRGKLGIDGACGFRQGIRIATCTNVTDAATTSSPGLSRRRVEKTQGTR